MEPDGIALSGEKMGGNLALFSEVFPDEYDFLNGALACVLVCLHAHPQVVGGSAIHITLQLSPDRGAAQFDKCLFLQTAPSGLFQ